MLDSRPPYLNVNEHGYWEARWTVNGTTSRESLRTKDTDEAKRRFANFLLGRSSTPNLTVQQAWLLRERETLHLVADPQRIRDCWKALQPQLGAKVIGQLSPADIANYGAARLAAGRQPSTVRRELVELRATLRYMVQSKRVVHGDLPYIAMLPGNAARPYALDDVARARVLAAAEERRGDCDVPTRLELFLHIGLATGQRRRAIERLEWPQVAFDHDTIHFARPGERVTKKRKASVPMRTELRALLLKEYQARQTDFVLRFPGSIRTAFDNLMRSLGLAHVTPHVLRHTFITDLLLRGRDVYTVSQLVGVTIKEIERTYGHLTQQHLRAAIERPA